MSVIYSWHAVKDIDLTEVQKGIWEPAKPLAPLTLPRIVSRCKAALFVLQGKGFVIPWK